MVEGSVGLLVGFLEAACVTSGYIYIAYNNMAIETVKYIHSNLYWYDITCLFVEESLLM